MKGYIFVILIFLNGLTMQINLIMFTKGANIFGHDCNI